MDIKVGRVYGTHLYEVTLTGEDAMELVPENKWNSMSLSKKAAFLSALGDVFGYDYARTAEVLEPEVADQEIKKAQERMKKCLK